MQAGKRHESPANVREFTLPDFDDLPPVYTRLQIVVGFTGYFAGMAHNTPIGVEEETVLLSH
jgi:hypothetical protein